MKELTSGSISVSTIERAASIIERTGSMFSFRPSIDGKRVVEVGMRNGVKGCLGIETASLLLFRTEIDSERRCCSIAMISFLTQDMVGDVASVVYIQ